VCVYLVFPVFVKLHRVIYVHYNGLSIVFFFLKKTFL